MARTALVSPCASFGKTAEVINEKVTDEIILKMTKQFNAFVSKEGFHDEDEFIIFGNDIEFEDVFHMFNNLKDYVKYNNYYQPYLQFAPEIIMNKFNNFLI
jgi:hypothetical protein